MLKAPRPQYELTLVNEEKKPVFRPIHLYAGDFDSSESRDDQVMECFKAVQQEVPEVENYKLRLLRPKQAGQIARAQRREAIKQSLYEWWNDTTRALAPDMVAVEYALEQIQSAPTTVPVNSSNIK